MAHHHTISGLVGKLVTEIEVNYNADKYYQIFKHHEEVPKAIPHIYMSMKVLEGRGMTSGCIKEWYCIHEGRALTLKERTTYNDETRTICHSIIGGDIANAYKKLNATLLVKGKFSLHGSRSEAIPWQETAIAHPSQPAPKHHSCLCKLAHKSHLSLDKLAHRPHLSHLSKLAHRPHLSHIKPILHHLTGCDCDMGRQEFTPTALPINLAPPALFHGSTVMWIIDYEKINEDSPVPIPYLAFFHRILQDLNSHFCSSY